MSGIRRYLSFCDWLIFLTIMSSRFIRVSACVRMSFLSQAEEYSVHLYYSLLICLSTDTWIASTSWLIVNDVGMYVGVEIFETLFSILLGLYLEVELLKCVAVSRLNFRGTAVIPSTAAAPCYVSNCRARAFQGLHVLANTCFLPPLSLNMAILMDVE